MSKRNLYLLLAVVGFIIPNVFVVMESLSSGNIMFYKDLPLTFSRLFANNYSTAFVVDLLFLVVLFMFWSYKRSKEVQFKLYWLVWIFTFSFGLASGLPLFLYIMEKKKEN